ncbi:hypothetical protein Tco_0442116 [Tanacetum coccineum]
MVNTSGLIDKLVKRMHPDSVCTCGWRYHQKWHSRPIFIQLQLLFDGKPLLYCADKLCWLSYKECLRKTPGALKSNMITMESWKKDEHYMKQGQNWKQNKRQASKLELEQSKLTAAISQLLTTMNEEPESKDGICQSDTDSKPTCGRPDEPLTSLKLTIIGHAPLASAQEGVAIEIAEAVVGALRGELAATAVNAPMVPAELRKKPEFRRFEEEM